MYSEAHLFLVDSLNSQGSQEKEVIIFHNLAGNKKRL
jgi:hypothetical protein